MGTARGIEGGNAPFAQHPVRSPSSPERTAPLWLAAAFFAAALAPGAQAQTTNPAELQAGPEQEQSRAEMLARELAAARRDVMSLLTLFKQEREHAALLERDLAAARRDVETQKELAAKASDEVTKSTAEKGSAELRQSLQNEQERAETLAQELAMARARIYAFEAQARQASDHAAELKQMAEGGVADLQTSLQQERDRSSRLEQDVAAARRDVEKQTALAAKAGEEARQMRQAADSAAELQKSLEQEQERTARLEQDVAAARRDVEKQTARPANSRQANQTKRRAESSAAWWFKSNSIWDLIFAPPRR
jgi:chromosome segregation ATPase